LNASLEGLVPLFQSLDFLTFPFPRRLCRSSVSQDALNATLLLFIFSLGSFSIGVLAGLSSIDISE
jgi:hypothetical protein